MQGSNLRPLRYERSEIPTSPIRCVIKEKSGFAITLSFIV